MSKTILYIEDNPDNMLLVERLISARGLVLLQAIDGLTGLVAAHQHQPNLILLDINLPDIDGYEVARQLRSSDATRHIPVIAITANALKGDVEKALHSGCDAYIAKPINLRDLWTNVSMFL